MNEQDQIVADVVLFLGAAWLLFIWLNGEQMKARYLGATLAGWAGAYLARRVYRRFVIGG